MHKEDFESLGLAEPPLAFKTACDGGHAEGQTGTGHVVHVFLPPTHSWVHPSSNHPESDLRAVCEPSWASLVSLKRNKGKVCVLWSNNLLGLLSYVVFFSVLKDYYIYQY